MLTYGDAVSDVNIKKVLEFHQSHGKTAATLTTVDFAQMKGVLDIDKDNTIRAFREKDAADATLINGGFMVMNPEIFDYIKGR